MEDARKTCLNACCGHKDVLPPSRYCLGPPASVHNPHGGMRTPEQLETTLATTATAAATATAIKTAAAAAAATTTAIIATPGAEVQFPR